MVVQVFDLLQVTTLLKSVIFALFFESDGFEIVNIFQIRFFRIPQGTSEQLQIYLKAPIASMIWILK